MTNWKDAWRQQQTHKQQQEMAAAEILLETQQERRQQLAEAQTQLEQMAAEFAGSST